MKRLIPCLLLAAALPLAAQLSLNSENREGKPILINSDAMNVDLEKGIATFYGNVIVNDPDVVITCKKMVLYQQPKVQEDPKVKEAREKEQQRKIELYKKMTKEEQKKFLEEEEKKREQEKTSSSKDPLADQGSKLERIECIDDVVITRKNTEDKNQWGTCGKAVYFHKQGSITMTIDPVLYQDESKITGIRLTFFRDSKQIEGTDIKITARNLREEEEDPKNPDKKKKKDNKKKQVKKSDAESVDEFYSKKKSNDGSDDSGSSSDDENSSKEKRKLTQKEADALLGLDKVPEKSK